MRAVELIVSLGLSGLGAAMVLNSHSMPALAHIDYGPGLFPTIVGTITFGLGIIALVRSVVEIPDAAVIDILDEAPMQANWLLVVIYAAMPVVFVVLAPILGFLLTMPIIIGVPAYVTSRRLVPSFLLALLLTAGLHIVFYELLRVALPWGILTPLSGVLTWR